MAIAIKTIYIPPSVTRPCHQQAAGPSRRRLVVVRAGLLDLLRGGGNNSASSIATDAEGEDLKAWLMERGLPSQKLAAASVPGSGRGLVATQRISDGESLLRIPRQLLLTPAAAQQHSRLRPLLEATPLPAWSVLAVWLAEQKAAGSGGEWWPYMRLLPERTGCVLEWTEAEVDWLRGSQLHADAVRIRAAADASWAELQPLLAAAEAQGVSPAPGAFSRQALQWAFGVLLSRLVRLPGLGDEEALVPWADLLNHDCSAAAFLDWSADEAAVVLRAERQYRPGEQLYISYGQKTSSELLLSYGFFPEQGSNPHDACRLRMQLPAGDKAQEWKAAALQRHGFAASELFPLQMAAAPYQLINYAAFAAAEVGSQEEAEQLAEQLFAAGNLQPALRRAALEAVVAACKAALAGYPCSLDADRAELDRLLGQSAAAAASGGVAASSAVRRRHVLQAVVYERQVLSRTVFVLQQELKEAQRLARLGQ